MLTSPRKLQKLFIKFVSWGAILKAKNLIVLNPELDLPLQKAFEVSLLNSCIRGAEWILELAQAKCITIDIHTNDNNLMKQLIVSEKVEQIRWLIKLSMNNGNELCDRLKLEGDQTLGTRKSQPNILELFNNYTNCWEKMRKKIDL